MAALLIACTLLAPLAVLPTSSSMPVSSASDGPLQYEVKGTSYRFVPYWQVKGSFTCFPMIQDIAGKNMCGKI